LGRAAYLSFHPSDHFQRTKGLGDVIIGTNCQTSDLIDFLRFSCQHNNWVMMLFTDDFTQVKACDIWQHDIKNRQRKAVLLDLYLSFIPICTSDDRKIFVS